MTKEKNVRLGTAPFDYKIGFHATMKTRSGKKYACDNRSDETEERCPCADDEFRCPIVGNPSQPRIPAEFICDESGIWDCPDGADEANCTSHKGHSSLPKLIRLKA